MGQVANQQALRELGASFQQIADCFGINKRTAYSHCKAYEGSKVKHWNDRSPDEQEIALAEARYAWENAFEQGKVKGDKKCL